MWILRGKEQTREVILVWSQTFARHAVPSPKKKKEIKRNSEEQMQEIRKDTENDREHKLRSLRNNERHFERKKLRENVISRPPTI